jgi:hypothetical protein
MSVLIVAMGHGCAAQIYFSSCRVNSVCEERNGQSNVVRTISLAEAKYRQSFLRLRLDVRPQLQRRLKGWQLRPTVTTLLRGGKLFSIDAVVVGDIAAASYEDLKIPLHLMAKFPYSIKKAAPADA